MPTSRIDPLPGGGLKSRVFEVISKKGMMRKAGTFFFDNRFGACYTDLAESAYQSAYVGLMENGRYAVIYNERKE